MLGTITGVGGGTIRDVCLSHVPNVLRFEILRHRPLWWGSACMIAARKMRISSNAAAGIGAVICFVLRRHQFMAALGILPQGASTSKCRYRTLLAIAC